jgi:DNA-directed RNA polymerase specialized sigma24 family protein
MAIHPFPTDSRFLEDLRKGLLQYARKHYGSSGLDLEDLVQDALLTVYENIQGAN